MIHCRNVFVFITSLFLFLLVSCGIEKKNDANNHDVEVIVAPSLGVTASAPQKSEVLYMPTASQKEEIKNNLSFFASKAQTLAVSNSSLFRATGSGGLGEDLTETDTLNPYDGIKLNISKNAITPAIVVISNGDKYCDKIFTYDSDNKIVRIDPRNLTILTICNVTITASGVTATGQTLSQSATFQINLNPTLKAYALNGNTTVKYLQVYSSLKDTKLIAQWVKATNQSANLVLKYDPIKTNVINKKLEEVNAITGAQNLSSLDLSGTDLKDLRAVSLLNNVQKLDISDTRIDPKDLSLLAQMPKLTSLAVRNLSIKDITYITNNLTNLVELDISGNNKISDLNDIQNLKNLRVLKASNTGLTNLNDLTNFTQLNSLDVSKNNLSSLTANDASLLVNLFNITELNFSGTKIKDEFLNAYFGAVANRNTLKKFVLRNFFDRTLEGGCDKINLINKLSNLSKLTQLEYIDLHGNGCNLPGYEQDGLTMTSQFSSMPNLKYLDISDTAVWDLSGVLRLTNLQTLRLWDKEGGISMNRQQCLDALRDGAVIGIAADCVLLGKGTEHTKSFTDVGSFEWVVPRNVTKVKILGCSGANGGGGGGGGGEAGALFSGSWYRSSWGGSGGAGGPVNDAGYTGGGSGSAGLIGCGNEGQTCPTDSGHLDSWQHGQNGGVGGIGGQTSFGDQKFSSSSQFVGRNPEEVCLGGQSGSGGLGGTNTFASSIEYGGAGGNGGTPAYAYGWSSKIENYEISVTLGQKIKINVGAGGNGGVGGRSGSRQGGHYGNGRASAAGASGSSGRDGFIKITWEE